MIRDIIKHTFVAATLAATLALWACGGEELTLDTPDPTAAANHGHRSQPTIDADHAGRLDAVLARFLGHKPAAYTGYRALAAGPEGSGLYVSPAMPGPTDRVTLLVEAGVPPHAGKSLGGEAHHTSDAWATASRARATELVEGTRRYLAFDLGTAAAGRTVTLAVRVDRCGDGSCNDSYWLNNSGRNYTFPVLARGAVRFLGERASWMGGMPVAGDGGAVFAGQPLVVTVQTYPRVSGQKVTLHVTTDGYSTVTDLPMRFDRDHAGAFGNNVQWVGLVPTRGLKAGAEVRYWISARDSEGNTRWDSRGGQNYLARVKDAPGVGWLGAGRFTFRKWAADCPTRLKPGDYYNWCYSEGLANPFVANYSTYQAYGAYTHLALEVYVPGVTDQPWDDASARAVGEQLFKAEVVGDMLAGKPGAAPVARAMTYAARRGNNFIFDYLPFCPGGHAQLCGYGELQNGTYRYRLRVSLDGGQSYTSLASAPFPQGGKDRTLVWDF